MSADSQADSRRHSVAEDAPLITEGETRARVEARNGLRQFDLGIQVIEDAVAKGSFRLRPSLILTLHRAALEGLNAHAGNFRPASVAIQGSEHSPLGAHLVPSAIEDMCDYVNDAWSTRTGIHLAAYVMWKLNWIHPFNDGNGRTSRITSYIVLCTKIGRVLPGNLSIPDQIVDNRKPYFDALEEADQFWKRSEINLSAMENLLESLLAAQLLSVLQEARQKLSGVKITLRPFVQSREGCPRSASIPCDSRHRHGARRR